MGLIFFSAFCAHLPQTYIFLCDVLTAGFPVVDVWRAQQIHKRLIWQAKPMSWEIHLYFLKSLLLLDDLSSFSENIFIGYICLYFTKPLMIESKNQKYGL